MQILQNKLNEVGTSNLLDTMSDNLKIEISPAKEDTAKIGEKNTSSECFVLEESVVKSKLSGLDLFGLSHCMGKLLKENVMTSTSESTSPNKDIVNIEKVILHQIEFYFSIYNLPADNFLKGLVDENEQGFVSLEAIYKFKKMRKFEPLINNIPNILKASKLLEISDDCLQIRRKIPIKNTQDHLETTYIWRSLFFSGFDLDQDLESLHFEFIQMLLTTAKEKMKIDIIGESGDYITGRVIPLFKYERKRFKKFKGSIQVVFETHDISIKFFEFFKKQCIFNGKRLAVQKRTMYDINNFLSHKTLAHVSGFPETIHKNSLAQFFRELSSEIRKIEFSHPEHGSIPFVIIRFRSDPTYFINGVNTTIFDAEKYPPKINPEVKLLNETSQGFVNPPPFLLNATVVNESEFSDAKAFLLQKAARTKRKREVYNSNSVWESMNKRSQVDCLKAAREFDHRDLAFL